MVDVPDAARCRGCGYPLRQLSTPRCPECGRAFDPTDPTTMALGRRPGLVGRMLLRPTGWPLVIAIVAGAIAVGFASRWPVGGLRAATTDWLYYFAAGRPHRDRLRSLTDWAYVAGMLLVGGSLIVWLLRLIARPLAERTYRRPPPPRVDLARRAVMATVAATAAVMAAGGVVVGWPYRLARVWARQALRAWTVPNSYYAGDAPVEMTDAEAIQVLQTGLARLGDARERIACLKLLVERHQPTTALPFLLDQIARERDPAMKVTLIHLVGSYRDSTVVGRLLPLWDDTDADVRAAATDALGLIHAQAYAVPTDWNWQPSATLTSDPPINIREATGSAWQPRGVAPVVDKSLDPLRPRFVDRMLAGRTDGERRAAARALLAWQPAGYRLRVAEWGVWIADQTGQLRLVQSVLDEIPPFVHRTGDSLASMAGRLDVQYQGAVTKPILHITVDRPMALDVQVLITGGRPWFAYPRPDDFTVTASPDPSQVQSEDAFGRRRAVTVRASPAAQFDRPGWSRLDGREGYPWIDPPHRLLYKPNQMYGWGMPPACRIDGAGLRWQSVIVSPRRLPWMVPPVVLPDPKFAWWERMRQVDCDWVSSCGEAERFLYYDGPTTAPTPVTVNRDGNRLTFRRTPPPPPRDPPNRWADGDRSFEPLTTRPGPDRRGGLYIEVADGRVRAIEIHDIEAADAIDLRDGRWLDGDPFTSRHLQTMLTAAGLTDDEADGLVDCWRPQLFHTSGSRFLLLMTAADYDALCPIRVDPPPTELVRVGLVLTEFPDAAATRPA